MFAVLVAEVGAQAMKRKRSKWATRVWHAHRERDEKMNSSKSEQEKIIDGVLYAVILVFECVCTSNTKEKNH